MQNVIKLVVLLLLVGLNIEAKENRLTTSVSLVGMSMDYREYDSSGKILDSEKSSFTEMIGVDLGMKYLMYETLSSYTNFEANIVSIGGKTDYAGSILGSGNPYGSYVSRTTNNIIDFDFRIKKYHRLSNTFRMNYGFGLGYHYWERKLLASFVELYEWYSLRASLGIDYKLSKQLKIGFESEYQYGFNETMQVSNPALDFDLGGADILKLSIPFVYTYSNKLDFIAAAVYTKQTIDHSNVINGYYEPDSTAKNQYIKIGLDFKY